MQKTSLDLAPKYFEGKVRERRAERMCEDVSRGFEEVERFL